MKHGHMTAKLEKSGLLIVLQDLDLLARRDDFLVGQAVRLSPPAVAGVWLRLRCFVGQLGKLRADGIGALRAAQSVAPTRIEEIWL